MDQAAGPKKSGTISDSRQAEIVYHLVFNRILIIFSLPIYSYFTYFGFSRGYMVLGVIFLILSINIVVSLILGIYLKEIRHLVRLKWVAGTLSFVLFGVAVISALMTRELYVAYPWVFVFPVSALLMLGERIGIIFALIYFAAAVVTILGITFPAWNETSIWAFKYSTWFSLLTLLCTALMAERTRVRMRDKLIDARNKYKTAEELQRLTNEELKSEITMRAQSEKFLAESEERYRILFEESSVPLWEVNFAKVKTFLDELPMEAAQDLEGYFGQNPDDLRRCVKGIWLTAVNRAGLKLYGAGSLKEVLKNINHVLPPNLLDYMVEMIATLHRVGTHSAQAEVRSLQGRKLYTLVSGTIPAGYEQSWEKVFISVYDITERVTMDEEKKRIDQQVQHTRQIQAIASLAGGIAHQFNNAMAVISGNVQLMALNLHDDAKNMHHLNVLQTSSDRIARLTEQLIAYAQGGKYQPMDFPLRSLVEDTLTSKKLPHDSLCRYATRFEEGVYLVGADITQVKMAIEAVLVNAVEAMENGGEIIVTVHHLFLDDTAAPDLGLLPGEYAIITIEDHGVGMDDETCQRVFEPFFSTKFVGRGLSMAAAYGIVRNHDGMIDVQSTPGQGTRVSIYLPGIKKGR